MASDIDVATLVIVCVTLAIMIAMYVVWRNRSYYVRTGQTRMVHGTQRGHPAGSIELLLDASRRASRPVSQFRSTSELP